jgi:hypothetical protein
VRMIDGSLADGFIIEGQEGTYSYGGIGGSCANFEIRNCWIRNELYGAGMMEGRPGLSCPEIGRFKNCLIENCYYGISLFSEMAEINGVTVTKCHDPISGGYGTVMNSIVYGNDDYTNLWNGNLAVSYSCVEDTRITGTGVIHSDPRFVDWAGGDYHLRLDSPCIDAGTTEGATLYDMDGDLRPQGKGVDIGVDEVPVGWRYNFFSSAEGWGCGSVPRIFSSPMSAANSGLLELQGTTNTDCFGFWQSPQAVAPFAPDSLYRARWLVGVEKAPALQPPTVRLRINSSDFTFANELVLNGDESQFGGLPLSSDSFTTFTQYFCSPPSVVLSPEPPLYFSLAFDLLNFDPLADPLAAASLDSVILERFLLSELTTPTLVQVYGFATSAESWTFSGAVSPFDSPVSHWEPSTIQLSTLNNTNTFGYWLSPAIDLATTNALYRAEFTVRSDQTNPTLVPTLRLRLGTSDNQIVSGQTISSVGKASQSPTLRPMIYSAYLSPPSLAPSACYLAFDLLSFDPSCAPTATLSLDSARLFTIDLNNL